MIETMGIALMSPAALATAPANTPAIETTYDWNTQKEVVLTNGKFDKGNFKLGATMYATTCHMPVSGNMVDDWHSD